MEKQSVFCILFVVAFPASLACTAFCPQNQSASSVRCSSLLCHSLSSPSPTSKSTSLFAKKGGTKKKKERSGTGSTRATRTTAGNRQRSASGFGGAAVEECPCGSGLGYMSCCGKIHKNADDYASATPEQVVRARYSAYAKREVDFIVGSTHPLNKSFRADIEQMKEDIRTNCYDNFELRECKILSEEFEGGGDDQIAKVKFVATMTQVDSREKTAFMETSTFQRGGKHIRQGAWLYRDGEVEPVPTDEDEEESENNCDSNE